MKSQDTLQPRISKGYFPLLSWPIQKTIRRWGRLRYYWLIPLFILGYAFSGNANTGTFAWWAFITAVACGIPLLVTNFNPVSLVSIFALIHVVYYPLAVIPNLMSTSPGVYEGYLWSETPSAMLACTLGMISMGIGSWLYDTISGKSVSTGGWKASEELMKISNRKLLMLVLLIVPFAFFKLYTNTYFHILAAGSIGWSEKNAIDFGYVGYVEYVVYAAALILVWKFLRGGSKSDLIYALVGCSIPVIVMLPSGSRDMIFRGVVPIAIIAILSSSAKFSWRAILVVLALVATVSVLMNAIDAYRGYIFYEARQVNWEERVDAIRYYGSETSSTIQSEYDKHLRSLGRRLADYVAVGQIIATYGNSLPLRYFEDIEYWPLYLLPNFVRPKTPGFDPRDAATLSVKVGFYGGALRGSTPSMLLGDLYSRFSWFGIVVGMLIFGFGFRGVDHAVSSFGFFQTIFYGLILMPFTKLTHDSAFGLFLFTTRGLIITFLLLWALGLLLRTERIRVFRPYNKRFHTR